jgi:CRP-like cAMP-binding protein
MDESLSAEAQALLAEAGSRRSWAKGAFLLREGAPCRHIHGIERGAVRVFQLVDRKDINLRFLFEDAYATDLKSLRSGQAADCSIQALEPTHTMTFDGAALRTLYDRSPEIERWGRHLLELLLIKEQDHANFFKLYSPEDRYAYLLEHEPRILARVSLSRLASYLGITRESLSRIRARIKS